MSTITVVNVRNHQPGAPGTKYVYIGRKCGKYDASPLGNPFHLAVDTPEEREKVLEQYEEWLEDYSDPPQWNEIKRIADYVEAGHDVRLGCWCAPKKCHGDIVKRQVEMEISRRAAARAVAA